MKIKVEITDNGKVAALEIDNADKLTQVAIIQSVFDLFGVDTDILHREKQLNKIEKAYNDFFSKLENEPINETKTVESKSSKEIKKQMEVSYEVNASELADTYTQKNDQPEFVRTGIKIRDGVTLYQTRYSCYACYDKSTLYIPEGKKQVWCRRCGHTLTVVLATKKPFPARDTFGNFYVAGDYKDWNVN